MCNLHSSLHSSLHFLLDRVDSYVQVRVKKAAYIKSSVALEQCPKPKLPEFAVIGRSNVGKSSLINMLTGQGSLAKVSKTPGAPCYSCSSKARDALVHTAPNATITKAAALERMCEKIER